MGQHNGKRDEKSEDATRRTARSEWEIVAETRLRRGRVSSDRIAKPETWVARLALE